MMFRREDRRENGAEYKFTVVSGDSSVFMLDMDKLEAIVVFPVPIPPELLGSDTPGSYEAKFYMSCGEIIVLSIRDEAETNRILDFFGKMARVSNHE